MAIWRPGLKRPRFLYIVTPEAQRRNKKDTETEASRDATRENGEA